MQKGKILSVLEIGLILTLALVTTLGNVSTRTSAASRPPAPSKEFIVDGDLVLTGMINEAIFVVDGGHLTLLGGCSKDIVLEPGAEAYIYGLVLGNVFNRGGRLEVHGIVGGYVQDAGDTFIAPDAIVVGTPPAVTPTPMPTPVPVTPTPSPTPLSSTPTPSLSPTPTPSPSTGTIDLSISLYKSVSTAAEREPYEDILAYFADAIYEMSNGMHKVRNVTIYDNGTRTNEVDVIWDAQEWPCAYVNGYGVEERHVYMGDVFNTVNFLNDRSCGGYTLAHEWGHYYYGLYDEYKSSTGNPCEPSDLGCPRPDDVPVEDSVMNNAWMACRENDFAWLNFSIPKNQTGQNAQYRVYNASAWETLIRPTSQDPRRADRLAVRQRTYYPEMATAVPDSNQDASVELTMTDIEAQARSELNIIWADGTASVDGTAPAGAALSSAPDDGAYVGFVESILGDTVSYPQPVILVAKVVDDVPIAQADVRAGVRYPDGTVTTDLDLKDDGVAPDLHADDGLYSGFMTYTHEGKHNVFVTFNNLEGTAKITEDSLEHATGPDGETDYPEPQPVGENFFAVANAAVSVESVKEDDHGNVITNATTLSTDNVDITGRIDYAADIDMFEVTPSTKEKLVLRISGLAFDMQPRIRVLGSEGINVIKEEGFVPEGNQYFFTNLRGKNNKTLYIAVSHLDSSVATGVYDISIGPALPNDIESPPLNILFIVIPATGVLILALIVWRLMKQRSVPHVAPPARRQALSPSPHKSRQKKESIGRSIYKGSQDVVDDDKKRES